MCVVKLGGVGWCGVNWSGVWCGGGFGMVGEIRQMSLVSSGGWSMVGCGMDGGEVGMGAYVSWVCAAEKEVYAAYLA